MSIYIYFFVSMVLLNEKIRCIHCSLHESECLCSLSLFLNGDKIFAEFSSEPEREERRSSCLGQK